MRTNEKTAISALLNTLNVAGSIVSINAIAFQPSIVSKVVERETDCVIALKKNIKILYEQTSEHLLARAAFLSVWTHNDRGRGAV